MEYQINPKHQGRANTIYLLLNSMNHHQSILSNFDYDLAPCALGCNPCVRLDEIFHIPHRVNQDADFALFDESCHIRGSVLRWWSAEHDVAAWYTTKPSWPPGVSEPIPSRGPDTFEGADVDYGARRLKVVGRVGI